MLNVDVEIAVSSFLHIFNLLTSNNMNAYTCHCFHKVQYIKKKSRHDSKKMTHKLTIQIFKTINKFIYYVHTLNNKNAHIFKYF
jgi:hypothetical protein